MVFDQALTDRTCPDPREGFAATSPTCTRDYSQKDSICRGPGLHVAISAYGGPGDRPLSIGSHAYCWCETHYDDDRQPPFNSAIGPVVQRVHAQTLTGQT